MIQGTHPLEKAGEAYQEVADRTELCTVILMSWTDLLVSHCKLAK
jgi:hypothetical protein